jgi:hypothetical protein
MVTSHHGISYAGQNERATVTQNNMNKPKKYRVKKQT